MTFLYAKISIAALSKSTTGSIYGQKQFIKKDHFYQIPARKYIYLPEYKD